MTPAAAALSEVMLHNSVNVMSAKRLDLGIVEYPFFTHADLDRLSDSWNAKSCNEVFRVGFRQNLLATFTMPATFWGPPGSCWRASPAIRCFTPETCSLRTRA